MLPLNFIRDLKAYQLNRNLEQKQELERTQLTRQQQSIEAIELQETQRKIDEWGELFQKLTAINQNEHSDLLHKQNERRNTEFKALELKQLKRKQDLINKLELSVNKLYDDENQVLRITQMSTDCAEYLRMQGIYQHLCEQYSEIAKKNTSKRRRYSF